MSAVTEKLYQELLGYDYIRFTWADLHGIQRGVTVAKRNLRAFLENGVYAFAGTNGMGVRTQFTHLKEIVEKNYVNMQVKPRPGTAHLVPWSSSDRYKQGEVLCNCYWLEGHEMESCSVNAANKQVQRLEEKGYRILSGFEAEFSLVEAESKKPVFEGTDFCSTLVFSESEDFAIKLDQDLEAAGVDLESLHTEYGCGQFEAPTRPQWGIKTADDMFIFKQATKEAARKAGLQALFMTRPAQEFANNGIHFTFSLWNKAGKNVMLGEDCRMSEVGNYFLAGLCHHGAAITALCAPTVNCYRRFFDPWAPLSICWAEGNRMAAFRTKLYGEKGACIENRLPSAAANPYLVLTATVAAGLDGIEKKLELPPESNTEGTSGTPIPKTLEEAMEVLLEDEVITEAIGKMMVDWFVQCKTETELSALPGFKAKEFDEETLAKEFHLYSRLL